MYSQSGWCTWTQTRSGRAESATVPELDKHPELEQRDKVRAEDEKIDKMWYSRVMIYSPAFNPKAGRPPQG